MFSLHHARDSPTHQRPSAHAALRRECRRPHLFEIVERRALRAGRRGRSRRLRRSAPSRNAACLRPAGRRRRPSLEVLSTRSAIAPTWRFDRPEVTTMLSAMVVLPRRSMVMVSSAFMSSRLREDQARVSSASGAPWRPFGPGRGCPRSTVVDRGPFPFVMPVTSLAICVRRTAVKDRHERCEGFNLCRQCPALHAQLRATCVEE